MHTHTRTQKGGEPPQNCWSPFPFSRVGLCGHLYAACRWVKDKWLLPGISSHQSTAVVGQSHERVGSPQGSEERPLQASQAIA